MKVNLIIPAAGAGSRFSKNGIAIPKPLINLAGKPFFYWSVISVAKYCELESLTFVVLKDHVTQWNIDKEIYRYFPEANVIELDDMTKGAAETCLKGLRDIMGEYGNDSPVLFNDCDHFFMSSELNNFLAGPRQQNWDAALVTFKSSEDKYSYVEYEDGKVVGTVEKKVVSSDAICGAYLFKDAKEFVYLYHRFVENCPYNELFVSGLYNQGPIDIKIFNSDAHIPFGVPEEYEIAKKFFEMFK